MSATPATDCGTRMGTSTMDSTQRLPGKSTRASAYASGTAQIASAAVAMVEVSKESQMALATSPRVKVRQRVCKESCMPR